jgi:hypothetical protein
MATNRSVVAYATNPSFTPGPDETGMQPSIETAIGYGSATAGPGAPATLDSQVIGGAATLLDSVTLPLTP